MLYLQVVLECYGEILTGERNTQGGRMTKQPTNENITSIYQAHCTQYENIMTRRFSLLSLVPGSTVAGFAITLFSDPTKTASLKNLILPLGLLGSIILLGLFFVARVSLREGKVVYNRILEIETDWGMQEKPLHEDNIFNQENVACMIFSVSLAGWICVAFWFVFPGTAIYIAAISFILSLIISYTILHSDIPGTNKPNFSVGQRMLTENQ